MELKEAQGKEQYHIEISNMFATLNNSDGELDVNKTKDSIRI